MFSKYASVIPLQERKYENIRDGLIKAFDNIGKRPNIVYSDDEGAMNNKKAIAFFEELDIQHIITTGSAHFVERFNRAFKAMLAAQTAFRKRRKRLTTKTENTENIQWHTLIPLVLAVYDNQNAHSSTGKRRMMQEKFQMELM